MASARDLRGGESVLLESGPGPAELSGNPRVNAVLNQLEEEMMCPGCHKEPGKSHCAGCGKVSYCGRECQVGDWKAGHKARCKLLKKASETIDELFALKRPLVKEPELDRLAKAYETFISANACTHRHFYKALVVVWRVSGRPSRTAQRHRGYLDTEESAMSMAEACQMFMTLHAKRIGVQEDDDSHLAEGKSDEVKSGGRHRDRALEAMKARMERQAKAELRAKIAVENEEIRKAVAGLALSRPEILPAESCTHDHAEGEVCTGAHGEEESEAWRAERSTAAQIGRRIKAYDKLVRLFESKRWEDVIAYAEEQLHYLHRQAREAAGRKQELRKSLEIVVYLSSLGSAYTQVDTEDGFYEGWKYQCWEKGLDLLEESIKLLGQTDLPAEPFYPLSLSGTRFNKPGGLPESIHPVARGAILQACKALVGAQGLRQGPCASGEGGEGYGGEEADDAAPAHKPRLRQSWLQATRGDRQGSHGTDAQRAQVETQRAQAETETAKLKHEGRQRAKLKQEDPQKALKLKLEDLQQKALKLDRALEKDIRACLTKHSAGTTGEKTARELHSLGDVLKYAVARRCTFAFEARLYPEAIEAADSAIAMESTWDQISAWVRQIKFRSLLELGQFEAAVAALESVWKELENVLPVPQTRRFTAAQDPMAVPSNSTEQTKVTCKQMVGLTLARVLSELASKGVPGAEEKAAHYTSKCVAFMSAVQSATWREQLMETKRRVKEEQARTPMALLAQAARETNSQSAIGSMLSSLGRRLFGDSDEEWSDSDDESDSGEEDSETGSIDASDTQGPNQPPLDEQTTTGHSELVPTPVDGVSKNDQEANQPPPSSVPPQSTNSTGDPEAGMKGNNNAATASSPGLLDTDDAPSAGLIKCTICGERGGGVDAEEEVTQGGWAKVNGCGHQYHALCLTTWEEVADDSAMSFACPRCSASMVLGWDIKKDPEGITNINELHRLHGLTPAGSNVFGPDGEIDEAFAMRQLYW